MKLVCSSDYGVPQRRYRVLIVGIDATLGVGAFDFDRLKEVIQEYNIPSEHFGQDEELLLGRILQGVQEQEDNVVWEYSATTQHTVNLIGGCEHGAEAMNLFSDGYTKDSLPQSVFTGRSWKTFHTNYFHLDLKKLLMTQRNIMHLISLEDLHMVK